MSLNVFELRGVYVFDAGEGSVPPSLSRYYNDAADRFEVPNEADLEALDTEWRIVTDLDAYRVVFDGDPPSELQSAALFVEEAPLRTTVLCPDRETVERALAAGGSRVDDDE
ncbi:hypothetical protein [Halobellus litoreus]|uniref:Halobacterial output domain-containing protein n=1 Tax=Halobellus litoreus TaxID=755310 RepID=A0ABD6E4E1_9EURY|nr:hypothetical protein [Halobellus litoreus]